MFEIEKLPELAAAHAKKYPPSTGYTVAAAQAVYDAYKANALPGGTNIGVQFALQFDGTEAGGDLIPGPERRLPYGASYSMDDENDCMDFIRNVTMLMTGRNPGDWTEGAYLKNKGKQVPWEERRPMDLLLNKLSDRNEHATHAQFYIGNGLILHTTSKINPLRVDLDTKYSAKTRTGTGVFRIFTDEEYKNMTVIGRASGGQMIEQATYQRPMRMQYTVKSAVKFRAGAGTKYPAIRTIAKGERVTYMGATGSWIMVRYAGKTGYINSGWLSRYPYTKGNDVRAVQTALKAAGYYAGEIDGVFGQLTARGVVAYQAARGLVVDGYCGPITWASLIG